MLSLRWNQYTKTKKKDNECKLKPKLCMDKSRAIHIHKIHIVYYKEDIIHLLIVYFVDSGGDYIEMAKFSKIFKW